MNDDRARQPASHHHIAKNCREPCNVTRGSRALKVARLAAVLSVLILAACQSRPSPTLTLERPRSIGPARGIDLPIDASDVLNELKDSRVDFVARYYRDPASRWPTLSASEVQRLSSLGKNIVAVWDSHSHKPEYFSYASGYGDAAAAYRQANAVGQPAGSAIYFAVDFNARGQELDAVDQYFRGIAAGFAAASGGKAEYKVGVYGSGAVCEAVKQAGLAQYSWLSNARAWAGSQSYTGWNIRQGARLPDLSFNHDSNEARDEYGAFRLAHYDVAAPQDGAVPPDVVAPQAPQSDQWLATAVKSWL
jgi:Domain of unknown function (DUF1906)